MIDIPALRRDNPLPDVAARVLALRPRLREWVACCPFHADRSPSFTIFDCGQRFHCFGCGASGDVLDFVQRAYHVSLPEAARLLGGGDIPKATLPNLTPAVTANRNRDAMAIWNNAFPAAGTPAEAYLASRGILPPFPDALRFQRLRCDDLGSLLCLVAAVRNVAGELTGIQRIWLAHDGSGKADVERPKRSLGTVKGGAIRLGELDASGAVTVCEGPEDGLSLLAMLGGPVWVAAGASFLPAMQFPAEVQTVVIGADNDPAGERAAREAALAFAGRGLSVRIVRPLPAFKDFNDELRGAA